MATTNSKAPKAVNYTSEQTVAMVNAYKAAPAQATVEALAESMGKTVRSVIAKLSREGVYQAKTYVSKTGAAPVKKDAHATTLAEIVGLSDGEADSLTKANKTALAKIVSHIRAMQDTIDASFDVDDSDQTNA